MTRLPATKRGDTWGGFDLTITEDAVPRDLTGATVRMQLRKQYTDTAATASWTTADNSILLFDAVNGVLRIVGRVLNVDPWDYLLDVEITWPDGTVQTVFDGVMTVYPDVTR
jgi:hypothetical protein